MHVKTNNLVKMRLLKKKFITNNVKMIFWRQRLHFAFVSVLALYSPFSAFPTRVRLGLTELIGQNLQIVCRRQGRKMVNFVLRLDLTS